MNIYYPKIYDRLMHITISVYVLYRETKRNKINEKEQNKEILSVLCVEI